MLKLSSGNHANALRRLSVCEPFGQKIFIKEGNMAFQKAKWKGYFGFIEESIQYRWEQLPKPLPWYEPSINMLYLEACSAWVFGNNVSSCNMIANLLEHSLKMALLDKTANGYRRKFSKTQLQKYYTFKDMLNTEDRVLNEKLMNLLDSKEEISWWINVAKPFRNAFSHMDIQKIISMFGNKEYLGNYYIESELGDNPGQWGHLWHRLADILAIKMLKEVYNHLNILYGNTKWESDLSWWESQKRIYDSFFLGEGISFIKKDV